MKRSIYFLCLVVGLLGFSIAGKAQDDDAIVQQVNQDDLGVVTDAFQECFFEALKQKSIENYEKAIASLETCEKIQPQNAVIFFEKGKNYKALEKYQLAVENFQKANRLEPNKEWVLVELMHAYSHNNELDKAILIAQSLISFHNRYYEDLANLYFASKEYDKLLALLDKLDAELGISEYRIGLRQQIFAFTNNTSGQIQSLLDAIAVNPENESNYLNLIFVYSSEGMEKEAFETAQKMQDLFPTSRVVHLALYKFYLESGNTEKALNSMKLVLEAEEIDVDSKLKVLNDFLLFVKENPVYEKELMEVAELFSTSEGSPDIFQKIGEYYLLKGIKPNALKFFELGIAEDLDNYELVKNTLLLQLDLSRYTEAATLSEKALEIFPAQPLLYLIRGTSLNQLEKYEEAEETLNFGLDFIIEDQKLQADFYQQLYFTYTGLGNSEKAAEFSKKAGGIK